MSVSLSQSDTVLPRTPTVNSTDRANSWSRLDGVDILRGLAIFFVRKNHVNMRLFLAKSLNYHSRTCRREANRKSCLAVLA
jgi:hypothetical protein